MRAQWIVSASEAAESEWVNNPVNRVVVTEEQPGFVALTFPVLEVSVGAGSVEVEILDGLKVVVDAVEDVISFV